ncbi:MAG: hypothetical protein HC796_11695, partial [Synechococcaceae cyanobacterium RL_1_2]|nr:hypothetical protein [Synechococcaceae cyanobacterium RL_1_2]
MWTQFPCGPGIPTRFSVTESLTPDITWRAATNNVSYELYRCEADINGTCDASSGTQIQKSDVRSYTEGTTPAAGKKWCYGVRGLNSVGVQSGFTSTFCGNPPKPDAPNDFRVTDTYSPRVTWDEVNNPGADTYKLYRCETAANAGSCNPTTVVQNTSSTSYQESSGPGADKRFCYSVTAVAGGVESDFSATDCGAEAFQPDTPDNFRVSDEIRPNIKWKKVDGASYELWRCQATGSNGTCTPTAGQFGSTLAYSGDNRDINEVNFPSPGLRYCYRVRSVVGSLTSGYSSVECGEANPPAAPANFRVSNQVRPTVTWDIVTAGSTNATYELYRCRTENNSCNP